jgi:phosphate transport system ATP-binding protein
MAPPEDHALMNRADAEPDPRPWQNRPPCCDRREPILEVTGLSVSYGETPALRDVAIPIPRGCITGVVGPSGCGKSTFLTCLNRMTDLVPGCRIRGSIRLEGYEILGGDTDLIALRRRVGMIFQSPNPFPLSIRKNLTFPLRHHGLRDPDVQQAKVERVLKRVGLWDEVKDRLGASAMGLSGGQQQRLCLARALVLEPEVLLLDEPCSALDPIAGGVVEDLIASLRGRYTIVIVTHNLAQARRLADDVAVFWMQDGAGAMIEHGKVEEVFENPSSPWTAQYVRGLRG